MGSEVHAGRANMLNPGDTFPEFELRTSDGGMLALPGAIDSDYAVVLLYRGHW